jgi:serine/threonine protein kinase
MKVVNKSLIKKSRSDVRHIRTERDVLVTVDHPFVVKLHYAFETPEKVCFVLDFCRGGELFRLLEVEGLIAEDKARFYLSEIACALEYLHSMDIVYRDLKSENVMLDEKGHVKLIDFGLSKIFNGDETLTNTFCGTIDCMAPEVVMDADSPGHGKPADWWSFGVFMFDLLVGRSPFSSSHGRRATQERILRGKFFVPNFVSPTAADLIRKLLRKSVDRRLGPAGVKAHPFFSRLDWDMVVRRAYQPPHLPRVCADDDDASQFDPKFTSQRLPEMTTAEECGVEDMFSGFEYAAGEVSAVDDEALVLELSMLSTKTRT